MNEEVNKQTEESIENEDQPTQDEVEDDEKKPISNMSNDTSASSDKSLYIC